MTTIYRKLFGGPDKPRPASFASQVREATARGSAEIAATNRLNANNPASSVNQRAAQKEAQRKNQRAVNLMLEGKSPYSPFKNTNL